MDVRISVDNILVVAIDLSRVVVVMKRIYPELFAFENWGAGKEPLLLSGWPVRDS